MKHVLDYFYTLKGFPDAGRFRNFKTDLFATGTTPGITVDRAVTTGLTISGATTTGISITGLSTTGLYILNATTAISLAFTLSKTEGLAMSVSSSKTLTTGMSISGSGTVTTGILLDATTFVTGISFTGGFTTAIGMSGGASTYIPFQVGTKASASGSGLKLSGSGDNSSGVQLYFDDGGASVAGEVVSPIRCRMLITTNQTSGTSVCGSFSQLVTLGTTGSTKALTTGALRAAYIFAQIGALTMTSAAEVQGINQAFTVAGDTSVGTGCRFVGVDVNIRGAGTVSVAGTGIMAAVLVRSSETTKWTTGIQIADDGATTGIDIGDCTTGVYFSGTTTTHISSESAIVIDMPVTAPGAGFDTAGGVKWVPFGKRGSAGMFVTELYIDLGDAAVTSAGTVKYIIGEAAGGGANVGQITAANHGTIVAMEIICLETPATGDDDIDFYSATVGSGAYNSSVEDLVETLLYERGDPWAAGDVKYASALPSANGYIYLTAGNGDTAGAYSAGKFLIRLYGT